MWLRSEAVNILRYLPDFIAKDAGFNAVGECLSAEHERQRLAVQDIFNQFFIQTATWGLTKWEELLEIYPKPAATYEERRRSIMLRLQAAQVSTKAFMERLVRRYTTDRQVMIQEHNNESYFDIIMDGDYTYDVVNGHVLITNGHYGQAITYIPEAREMVVSGLDGEPDKKCFLVSDRDAFYTVDGTRYVARDGYVSKKALDYFDLTYGGLYTDESLKNKVSSLDYFYKETDLYLGKGRHVSSDKGYIGDWYLESDMNKLKYTITEGNLGTYLNSDRAYEIDETKDEIIITSGLDTFVYDKYQGALYATDGNGNKLARYKKYDPNTEAICKIYYNNIGDYESIVYQIGEKLTKRFVSDNIIGYAVISSYFDENGNEKVYNDEPIIKNMIAKGSFGHRYMKTLQGKFGENYMSYWQITDKFGANRMDDEENHRFYLQRVEMGKIARTGWFHFTEASREVYKFPYVNSHGEYVYDENGLMRYYEMTFTVYKAYAQFEDHSVLEARVHFTGKFSNNPDTGDYEEDESGNRVDSEIRITLEDGRYQFERNGKTYFQQI